MKLKPTPCNSCVQESKEKKKKKIIRVRSKLCFLHAPPLHGENKLDEAKDAP